MTILATEKVNQWSMMIEGVFVLDERYRNKCEIFVVAAFSKEHIIIAVCACLLGASIFNGSRTAPILSTHGMDWKLA